MYVCARACACMCICMDMCTCKRSFNYSFCLPVLNSDVSIVKINTCTVISLFLVVLFVAYTSSLSTV